MTIKLYQKQSHTKITKDFDSSLFACKGVGCCNQTKIDSKLVEYIQQIHDRFGKKVTINSGYRCAKHNAKVKGAFRSKHTYGMAADIVVDGISPTEVAKYAETIGILGIGLYNTSKDGRFVHIDTRTGKFFWYGQGQAYRSTHGGYAPSRFIADIQCSIGAKVDGIAGDQTLSKTVTISAKDNAKHDSVKFVQKRLYALGYTEVGNSDGLAGSKFTKAVKRYQKDNGIKADGVITSGGNTWRKLLGMS